MSTRERRRPRRIEPGYRRLSRNAIEAVYSRIAGPYDAIGRFLSLGEEQVWREAALPFLLGPRVLEVGMGTGNLLLAVDRAGYNAYGIDRAPAMLREALKKFRSAGRPGALCCAGVQALPFPNACFDSIASTFGSDYIVQGATYREIARVLRPGGRLVVVPGGRLKKGERLRGLLQAARRPFGGILQRDEKPGERLIYTYPADRDPPDPWIGEIKRLMLDTGFQVTMYLAPTERSITAVITGDKV